MKLVEFAVEVIRAALQLNVDGRTADQGLIRFRTRCHHAHCLNGFNGRSDGGEEWDPGLRRADAFNANICRACTGSVRLDDHRTIDVVGLKPSVGWRRHSGYGAEKSLVGPRRLWQIHRNLST